MILPGPWSAGQGDGRSDLLRPQSRREVGMPPLASSIEAYRPEPLGVSPRGSGLRLPRSRIGNAQR
jgi:hypothetical protein